MKNLTDVMIMKAIGTIYLTSFVTTIIIVNIFALPFCIIRKLIFQMKTPEQRRIDYETRVKRKENRKAAQEVISAFTGMNESTMFDLFKFKELEKIYEDFIISRCIWRANLKVVEMFIVMIQAVIGIIVMLGIIAIFMGIIIIIGIIAIKISINQITGL